MGKSPNVLKGKKWHDYLMEHNFKKKDQMELYSGVTHNHVPIYKIGDYYFSFQFTRGYKNITALKRLVL